MPDDERGCLPNIRTDGAGTLSDSGDQAIESADTIQRPELVIFVVIEWSEYPSPILQLWEDLSITVMQAQCGYIPAAVAYGRSRAPNWWAPAPQVLQGRAVQGS